MPCDSQTTRGGKRLTHPTRSLTPSTSLVSVITAVFNGRDEIARCIESVLAQDYPHIEHIVVDGGSMDGTVDVLRSYEDKIALWISEPDRGVYDAWNKGLKLAQGDWICFLGADDIYLPGAVSEYMSLALKVPEAEFLCSRIKWVHPTGYHRIVGEPWEWRRFSRFMCTAHPGSMHSRRLFERYGGYNTEYRIAADYEFLLRAKDELRVAYHPGITVEMRAGGISDSTAALKEAKKAKVDTGARSPRQGELEFLIAWLKFRFRWIRRGMDRVSR